MILEIQQYIRDTLQAIDDLSCIAAYVFGDLPRPWPASWFPACQIVIVPQVEQDGSISHNEQRYDGMLLFWSMQAAKQFGIDSYTLDSDNTAVIYSYTDIAAYVKSARNELQKTEYYNLGDLVDADGEYVCRFVLGDRVIGSGQGERTNTWENVGQIAFSVYTERLKE